MFRSSSVLLMTFKAAVDRFILKKNCVVIMRKLKLRLPYQEQYVKAAYAFIVVFTVVGASMLFLCVCLFFFGTIILFSFIC